MFYDRIVIYFDGASRRNPFGPAGCGWVMYEMDYDGAIIGFIAEGNRYLGYNVSNNQAEYEGLYYALAYLYDNCIECDRLYIRGDSQVVINQLDGYYQVRSPNIIDYYNSVQQFLTAYSFVKYTHIDRSWNIEADELANDAIDYN